MSTTSLTMPINGPTVRQFETDRGLDGDQTRTGWWSERRTNVAATKTFPSGGGQKPGINSTNFKIFFCESDRVTIADVKKGT